MDMTADAANIPPEILLGIIKLQGEIVKLGLDLGGVMDLVADQVRHLTGASGAIVEMAEGDEMVYRAATGIAAHQLGLRLKRSGSLSGLCVETGQALFCDDSETDPRVDREACRRVGLRSMVVSPLRHRDTVVGAIKIVSPLPAVFTRTHAHILSLLSDLVAASMFFAARHDPDELYHRATHDALTGLANRALFYDHLRQGLAQARRQEQIMGIVNLDMDGLKDINDTLGHRAGDAAICELAGRIRGVVRESDLAARLGGDEFGVILPRVDGRAGSENLVDRMRRELCATFCFEDVRLRIDASIGLALFPEDGQDVDDLMEKADQAMYAEKRRRKAGRYSRNEPTAAD